MKKKEKRALRHIYYKYNLDVMQSIVILVLIISFLFTSLVVPSLTQIIILFSFLSFLFLYCVDVARYRERLAG